MVEERIVENVHKMFNKELIFVFPHMEDKETLIERLGSAAVERALVLPSFTKAVIDREKDYPTGLSTEYIDLAVPHTDACHVIQQAIIVAKLDDPVTFVAMGSDDETVAAKYVFLLLLKNDGEQVNQYKLQAYGYVFRQGCNGRSEKSGHAGGNIQSYL